MLWTPPGWIVLSPVESSSVGLRGARGRDTVHHSCLLPTWLNRLVCLSISLALSLSFPPSPPTSLSFSPAGAKQFPRSPCPQRPVVPLAKPWSLPTQSQRVPGLSFPCSRPCAPHITLCHIPGLGLTLQLPFGPTSDSPGPGPPSTWIL